MIGLGGLAAMLLWIAVRGSRVSLPLASRVEPALDVAQTAKLLPGGVTDMAGARPIPRPVPARTTVLRPRGVPPEFDVEAFVRIAKVHFLRLQSAWDAKDLTSISQFTTPEIFADIRTQLEREAETSNHTRVVELEAELLGFRERTEDWLASVRFDGMIRERPGTPAEPFQEVWNLSKRKQRNAVWLLAGIQPLH
jgi:predicted lipid-binding transport protein (Tim44 family)